MTFHEWADRQWGGEPPAFAREVWDDALREALLVFNTVPLRSVGHHMRALRSTVPKAE